MRQLRVVIADDERPARAYIRSVLERCEGVELIGEAANGADAITLIEREAPDLALLDLQMPELDGLDVVRLLTPERRPLIAFVTAYDAYAVKAFEVNAIDYLLKPVDAERLRQTLDRARIRLTRAADAGMSRERVFPSEDFQRLQTALLSISERTQRSLLRRIPVRRRDDILFVSVDEIASIVADGELLHISTFQGERYVITFTLKELELRLNETQFLRISRSAIVNVDAITKVSPMPGGTYIVTLSNKQQLPVSRMRSRVLRDTLLRL